MSTLKVLNENPISVQYVEDQALSNAKFIFKLY